MKRSKRILIVDPERNLPYNPNFSAIVGSLSKNGFGVDILSSKSAEGHKIKSEHYRLFGLDHVAIHKWGRASKSLIDFLLKKLGSAYGLIIGVDQHGVIIANAIASAAQVPKALINYEIFFASEIGIEQKEAEIRACVNVAFVVCQDALRAGKLVYENHLDKNKVLCIPVAGKMNKTNKLPICPLRQKYHIDDNKSVAIYIGSFESWTGLNNLLLEISSWPDNWVLVVHGKDKANSNFCHQIESYIAPSNGKLIFSDEPFKNYDDLCEFVSGADVGIAIYSPDYIDAYSGDNLKYVGMSSGKISTYLMCSLPVIVNEIGIMSSYVKKYSLGYVLSDGGAIKDILVNISRDNLLANKQKCRSFFEEKLAFDNYEEEFMKLVHESYFGREGNFLYLWSTTAMFVFRVLSRICYLANRLPIFKRLIRSLKAETQLMKG